MQNGKEVLQGFLLIFGVNSMKNIMIKSAIATAVIAATTATAIADATVYGRLRMAAVCNDAGNGADTDCGLENRSSRFGIKATSEISDGLTAFGKYEFGVSADEGAAVGGDTNRLAYVGIKGGFGEVSIGTRWSPLYNHTISPVDPTNAFGGTWAANGYQSDFRNSDTINYKNKFGAASVGVQIQMDDGDAGSDAVDEVTVGASFKAGPATIGVGYQDNKDNWTQAAIHARGKFGPVGIGGTFSTRDNDSAALPDVDSILLSLNYSIGGGKDLFVSYGQDDIDGGNTPSTIGLEYVHNLGAGFKWFAGFDVSDADVSGVDDSNRYGAGMRYDF